MKKTISIYLLLGCVACENSTQDKATSTLTYEIFNGDTINRMDINGNKQGPWCLFNSTVNENGNVAITHGAEDNPMNSSKQGLTSLARLITQEGFYVDSKKQGYWKYYYSDGSLQDSVEYNCDTIVTK